MTATFLLPGPLRPFAGGAARIDLPGSHATVGDAFRALRAGHPAVYDRVITERGEVRPHVNVFVGDAEIRRSGGLDTPLPDAAEIVVLPAVSGG